MMRGSNQPLSMAQRSEWIATLHAAEYHETDSPSDWLSIGLFLFVAGLAYVWLRPAWRELRQLRLRPLARPMVATRSAVVSGAVASRTAISGGVGLSPAMRYVSDSSSTLIPAPTA